MNRYETSIPRVPFGIAAATMTAIVFGLLVVLPAKMELDAGIELQAKSRLARTEPIALVVSDSQVARVIASQFVTLDSNKVRPPTVIR